MSNFNGEYNIWHILESSCYSILFVSFQSVLNFLNDPTGEMPWEEEDGAEDVKHIKTVKVSKYSKATCVFLRL